MEAIRLASPRRAKPAGGPPLPSDGSHSVRSCLEHRRIALRAMYRCLSGKEGGDSARLPRIGEAATGPPPIRGMTLWVMLFARIA